MDTPVLFRSKRIRVVVLWVRLTKTQVGRSETPTGAKSLDTPFDTPGQRALRLASTLVPGTGARVRTRSNVMPDWPLRATRDAAWWRVSVSRLAIVPLCRVRLCPRGVTRANVA